jgi:hypothetical protein
MSGGRNLPHCSVISSYAPRTRIGLLPFATPGPTMTACQKLARSPSVIPLACSDPITLRFLRRSKPSMKSLAHQCTFHLSFMIKCCVDRLRPPGGISDVPAYVANAGLA